MSVAESQVGAEHESVKRLKLIRGGNRGKVTKIQREVIELLQTHGNESSTDKEEFTRQLAIMLKTLKEKQSYLTKLDEEILQRCPMEEIEREIDEATDISIKIDEIVDQIEEKLRATSCTSTRTRSEIFNILPSNELNVSASSNRSTMQGIKLPKLNLPRFNGDITKFQPFWQSFKCAVDSHESLTGIQKLTYLINSLEGPAFKALEGLDIIESNYEKASQILQSRFGKSQQIISAHMQELLNLQSYPSDKTNQLRSIYDSIMVHIRGLESLGVSSAKYGSLLIPVIMSRMPTEIALQVARKTSEDIWKIDEIMEIIRKEIEAREVSERVNIGDRKRADKVTKIPSCNLGGTTKSFVAQEKKRPTLHCYFCKKEHVVRDCQEITDVKKRIQIISSAKRCLNCFKTGHVVKDCFSKGRCRNCNGKHNTLLCQKTSQDSQIAEKAITTSSVKQKTNVLLQTAKAFAFGDDRSQKIPVNILFDCGSQKSYVTEEIKNELSLNVKHKETVNLNTFGSQTYSRKVSEHVIVNLEVNDEIIAISALTTSAICSPISSSVDVRNYPHLTGLQLANKLESSDQHIGILIGADQYYDVVLGEVIKGSSGPVAISSKLGWLLSGPVISYTDSSNIVSNLVLDIIPSKEEVFNESKEITEALDKFWKHESLGLLEETPIMQEKNKSTIEYDEKQKRYQVSLPWKNESFEPLTSDYEMCKNRLNSLYRKLKGQPDLLIQYDRIFKDQLAEGVIERASPEENTGNTHFLCHFGVIRNERETTKLRVVFDGSAKSLQSNTSLNDRLEVGDNNMPLIFDTLIRFRVHKIAITADIEKAFLQVGIRGGDRDVLRFLWFDDVLKENPEIIQYRYCRLVFGLTCSPAILSETIHKHVSQFRESNPEIVNILMRLYADDMSCGTDTVEEAINIYKTSKEILAQGGFNLRKWNSNSKAFLNEIKSDDSKPTSLDIKENKISEDDQSYSQFAVGNSNEVGSSKVLGVSWNSNQDTFCLDLSRVAIFAQSLPPTKRSVLRISAKIFDPFGYLCVFTINLKAFFQQLCVDKLNWDDDLQGQHRKTYDTLLSELPLLQNITISRCLFKHDKVVKNVAIHGFSDASERAYAAVVYLKIEYESGEVDIKFVASKTKVAPIKKQSIPRLELLGACLLAKLAQNIQTTLQDELRCNTIQTYFWVDSMSVLCWIKNNKPWTQYVRHRVSNILSVSDREQWYHCPGFDNPADLPSRGKYASLAANRLWWEGPEFLKCSSECWPRNPLGKDLESSPAMAEKVKHDPIITHAMLSAESYPQYRIHQILDTSRFSKKGKLLRTIAWIMRFISNLKSAMKKEELSKGENISVSEINEAEIVLIRSLQSEVFSSEIGYLITKAHSKPPLYITQFNLFLDESKVLRCRTRVGKSDLAESSKTPILLKSNNHYSKLLIEDCHNKVCHNGTRETLNLLRQKYWILRGREKVKGIIHRCVICKKIEGLPFKSITSSDLPSFRVDNSPPFTHTGVDFAGPLLVSDKENTKYYVCLFTCAVTRAVHLEIVDSLSVESFVRAFRRFCARRGLPGSIISDNAKTFKSASLEIKKLIRSPRLHEHLTAQGVKWKFITELAPWQGGMWERLVRSVKRCLIKTVGRSMLTLSELSTILVEIEGVINSRPLTYVYDDKEGVSFPLTPSQLINGRNLQRLPNDGHYEIVSTYEGLSRRARYHHRLLTQFSARWRNDYLLSLLEAYRARGGNKEPVIENGDIVILRNDQQKRSFWKLAKILVLYPGQDGSVRSAKIQVAGNDKKVLTRSLKHLIPLECRNQSINSNVDLASSLAPSQESVQLPVRAPPPMLPQVSTQTQPQVNNRPKRNAATIGELRRRDVKY